MIHPAALRQDAEGLAQPFPPLLAAAEHLASSVLLGEHGRRRAGMGEEFWQYRASMPGDERRMIDWRRSGRSDSEFVREKEWQAAQSVMIWVDPARSMGFTSGKHPEKGHVARVLALAAAVLLIRAGERVGLTSLAAPPRTGQLQLLRLAASLAEDSQDEYGVPELRGILHHSRAVFVSDFLGDLAPVETALAKAADRDVKGAILQVLDPAEEAFPFDGRTIFESMGGTISHETLKAGDLRGRYLERLAERKARLEDLARRTGWQYSLHHTDASGTAALLWLHGALGFTAPWLLLALIALPVLWFLLRAVPPAPIRRRFPGVALLLGLEDDEQQSDKTPWWLLLLRMLAVALLIIGFAGPVLNPEERREGSGPLLVAIDATWADAGDWARRIARLEDLLSEAGQSGRTVAVVALTNLPSGEVPFQSAEAWSARLPGLEPAAWRVDPEAVRDWSEALEGSFETFWMSDGLDAPWRGEVLAALEARGPVTVFESPRPVAGLRPAAFENDNILLTALRSRSGEPARFAVAAHGLDPAGTPRRLARAEIVFAPSETEASVELSLPSEVRNRVTRFEIEGLRSAGAVSLTDDALRRREVALIAARDEREGLRLLSPTHYLEQALAPSADLIDGALTDVILASPDVIVLADVATLAGVEAEELLDWVEGGGLLVRFAGPRMAASDVSRAEEDPLMPVRLRAGGRTIGGAMSWGEPKRLRAFGADSPFFGLPVPDEVQVSAQVMAQPDPSLPDRVIASLADGTPLVTRKRVGSGQVVLFHVTANAEWSTLPLSGLFVDMLDRLAVSTRPAALDPRDLAGTTWQPDEVLSGFGEVSDAGVLPGVPGEVLAEGALGPDLRPGLYVGEDRRIALNVVTPETRLVPSAWPARVPVEGLDVRRETPLKGAVLAAALGLLLVDILASLWLSGRLKGARAGATAVLVAALVAGLPGQGEAQTDEDALALAATSEAVLAHIVTGDPRVDEVARAGLRGLSDVLTRRTSIEPAEPIGVDLEMDELSFFPFLYWPVTSDQPRPSTEAYAKLNRYLRTGGMILFDTRDADIAAFGGGSGNGAKLRTLAAPLDIPPLEPIPDDHVLTRTFYLLQDFPGRHDSRDVWVEAAPADAERAEGMPFRNLNDNVTPVVIGGNDWASAWAISADGGPMFPVGRGFAGERQREIAYRFGINLIMHVLTGNYKSDQVHVPALLDRLGQ